MYLYMYVYKRKIEINLMVCKHKIFRKKFSGCILNMKFANALIFKVISN